MTSTLIRDGPAEGAARATYPSYMTEVAWTDTDPLKLRVEQDGETITLMTYRLAAAEGQRKGVVFYIHGFGAYCEKSAYMLKQLADRGYEVFALDQRGFGNSGGQRGLFESQKVIYGDLYLFVYRAIQQYKLDLEKVPLFLVGKSFGGALAFNLALRYPQLFKGFALVAPFFQHKEDTIDKYQYAFKFCNIFQLFYSFTLKDYPAQYQFIGKDPKIVHQAKISTLVHFYDEQQYARKHAPKMATPFILINATEDATVRNSTNKEIVQLVKNPANKIVELRGADHLTITYDPAYAEQVYGQIADYFDTLLPSGEAKGLELIHFD
ncbi:hypothetical protein FGO68_gene13523 [Halteria grandinella]|uniref:Serine aminopeptidase S33 domain-containing protein n=1 Tax=Halteria grandinella TaxID=5974 RepID=A0A8J8T4E7_HALGN|nr:hypothetical protein FGO68_gene13523 [Halteria grandinella]